MKIIFFLQLLNSVGFLGLNKNQQTFKQDLPQNTKTFIEATAKLFTNWTSIMFSTPLKNFFNRKDIAKLKKCQMEQFSAFQQYYKSLQNEMVQSKLEQLIEESDLDPAEKEVILYDVFTDSIDTVAHVAAFVCYCLAVNPEKQEVLRNEIKNVFASSNDITGKTLLQMPYLHAFNLEVQRLYPLTMGIARKTSVDMVLSGYHVPANTSIELTANIVNNRDPKYFDDPDSFISERWLDRSKENRFVMSGSFGMGTRMCPGRKLVAQEIGCLVIALLTRYKITYRYEPFEMLFQVVAKPEQKSKFTFVPL